MKGFDPDGVAEPRPIISAIAWSIGGGICSLNFHSTK